MKLFNRSQKFEVSKRKFDRLEAKAPNQLPAEHRSSPIFWLKKEKTISCQILLLDGSDIKFTLDKKALGEELLERVYVYLDLIERDYFGLQFMDHLQVAHWLDPTKSIKKQVKIGPPYSFSFRVKFYSSEPNNLREELTRYQFFLQLKRDILTGKIPCPYETAVELSAYALQSELGDYNAEEHTAAYISEFRFVPDQTEKMELDIIECYKEKKNQTPAQAEINYLTKVKWLDLYGIDFHTVLGKDGFEYSLGLTPTGVLVFERKQKIGLFLWPKINRFDFKNKKVILVVEEDEYVTANEQDYYHQNGKTPSTPTPPILIKKEHTFVFRTYNYKAAKHLWKCAVQYHAFFRLIANVVNSSSNTANGHVSTTSKRSGNNFFRMGSRFRYSGKTEFQATFDSKVRKSMQIERKPSQRYSRRPPNPHFLQQQSQKLQILNNKNTNNDNLSSNSNGQAFDDILNHPSITTPNLDIPDFFSNLNIDDTTQPKLLSLSPIKEHEPAKILISPVKTATISPNSNSKLPDLIYNQNNIICNNDTKPPVAVDLNDVDLKESPINRNTELKGDKHIDKIKHSSGMDTNVYIQKDMDTKSHIMARNHNNLECLVSETKDDISTKASIPKNDLNMDRTLPKGQPVKISTTNDHKIVNRTKLLSRKSDKTLVASPENEKYGQLVEGDNYIESPIDNNVDSHLQTYTTRSLVENTEPLLKKGKNIEKLDDRGSGPPPILTLNELPNSNDIKLDNNNTIEDKTISFGKGYDVNSKEKQSRILVAEPIKVTTSFPEVEDEPKKFIKNVSQSYPDPIVLTLSPSAKKRARKGKGHGAEGVDAAEIAHNEEALLVQDSIQSLPQSPGIKRSQARVNPNTSGEKKPVTNDDDQKYAIYDIPPKNIEPTNEPRLKRLESGSNILTNDINNSNDESLDILQPPSVHLRNNSMVEEIDGTKLNICPAPLNNVIASNVVSNKSVRFNPDIVTHLRPASSYSLTDEDIKSKIGFFEAQSQHVQPPEKDGNMLHLDVDNPSELSNGTEDDRFKNTHLDITEYLDALSNEENDEPNLMLMDNGHKSEQNELMGVH